MTPSSVGRVSLPCDDRRRKWRMRIPCPALPGAVTKSPRLKVAAQLNPNESSLQELSYAPVRQVGNLLVVGIDDGMWPSAYSVERNAARLARTRYDRLVKVVTPVDGSSQFRALIS